MKLLLPLVMTDKQQSFILDGNVLLWQTGKLLSVELLLNEFHLHFITLHASCSALYCNWSCLFVCGSVTTIT